MNEMKSINRIIFKSRNELVSLEISKIVYFQSEGNYTRIVTTNKLQCLVNLNLSEMEKALAQQLGAKAAMFVRVGRTFIINVTFLFRIDLPKQRLVLTNHDTFSFQLPVGKEAAKKLKSLYVLSIKSSRR